jgi:hypothetical protein
MPHKHMAHDAHMPYFCHMRMAHVTCRIHVLTMPKYCHTCHICTCTWHMAHVTYIVCHISILWHNVPHATRCHMMPRECHAHDTRHLHIRTCASTFGHMMTSAHGTCHTRTWGHMPKFCRMAHTPHDGAYAYYLLCHIRTWKNMPHEQAHATCTYTHAYCTRCIYCHVHIICHPHAKTWHIIMVAHAHVRTHMPHKQ